ncbi:hypothetical protein FE77_14870, partial [Staphylococcus aureus]
ELIEQVRVDDGIVRIAEAANDRGALALVARMEMIDIVGIEDLVHERAAVGRLERVPTEHEIDPYVRIPLAEVERDLGRALAAADH